MVYLEINSANVVTYIHYLPFDPIYGIGKTEEELRKKGFLVAEVPEYTETLPDGKIPELHYDGKDFSWSLTNSPKPQGYAELRAELDQLYAALEKGMTV